MSAERPPEQRGEAPVSPERELKRYPYIGFLGAVAAGKSELSEILVDAWGQENVVLFREDYPRNPWLKMFYEKPGESGNSFRSEAKFLLDKIALSAGVRDLSLAKMLIHDPAKWNDTEVFAFVHWEMGWMSPLEYELYLRIDETLSSATQIPEPDIIIVTITSPETVCERIRERARQHQNDPVRQREVGFMERYPDYFPRLATRVVEWIDQNPHGVPIIPIDSGRFNYVLNERDRNLVMGQIRAGLAYELFNPRGRNGVGKDGAKLVFPSILRPPHLPDVAPSSLKPARER